jgi:hypothetical protein
MSKTFKMSIMTKSNWFNCSEVSLELKQKICTFDFEPSLNIGIVMSALNDLNLDGKDVHREVYLESFNEDHSLPEFYNELLDCLDQNATFEISCSDSVSERLTMEQRRNLVNPYKWEEGNQYNR